MLGGDFEPVRAPLAERLADREEVVTRGCELIVAPAPVGLGCRLDDAEPLEPPEALREQGAGEPGRALQDLAEASAAKVQVADDQWRPALGKDLGATGDGAVLAVRPHDASVAHPPSVVKSRFLTSRCGPRWFDGAVERGGHDDDIDAGVCHGSKEQPTWRSTHSGPTDQPRPRRLRRRPRRLERCHRPPPTPIATCIGAADVVAAVRFARDRDLEIAIRGGGHNVAGTAVCDDGIVIDLSAMRGVRVDPAERSAWVQGGALWGDVDHETQAHGLATTGAGCLPRSRSLAGLTLGGGVGWLMHNTARRSTTCSPSTS